MKVGGRDDEAEGKVSAVGAAVAIRGENEAAQDDDGVCKKIKNPLARQAHRTRSASKCEQSVARQEERDASDQVVSVAYERN